MTGDKLRPACADHNPELFFPDQLGRPAANGRDNPQVVVARAVCAGCPVQQACLQVALANGEDYGVWGGTTPAERRELLSRLLVSRPLA